MDSCIIPDRDGHVCVLGALGSDNFSLLVEDNTLVHSAELEKGRKIKYNIKM